MISEILGELRGHLGPAHVGRLLSLIVYETNASGREDAVDIVLNGESLLQYSAREIARRTLFRDTDPQSPTFTESDVEALHPESDVEADIRPLQEHQGAGRVLSPSPRRSRRQEHQGAGRSLSPSPCRLRSRPSAPSGGRQLPSLRTRAEIEEYLRTVSTIDLIDEVAARNEPRAADEVAPRASGSQAYQ